MLFFVYERDELSGLIVTLFEEKPFRGVKRIVYIDIVKHYAGCKYGKSKNYTPIYLYREY